MTPRALRAALKRRMDALLAHIRAELDPDLVVAESLIPDRYFRRDLNDVGWRSLEDEDGHRPAGNPTLDYQRVTLWSLGIHTVADTDPEFTTTTRHGRFYIGKALDLVAEGAPVIVAATADNLLGAVGELLAPHTHEAAIMRLVDRWPWTDGREEPRERNWLYLLISWCREVPSSEPVPLAWPAEAAPVDVHQWAQGVLNQAEPGRGDRFAKRVSAMSLMRVRALYGVLSWKSEGMTISGVGLALLFLAAAELEPRAPSMGLLSVERAPVRLATSLAGAHPGDLKRGATLESEPTELVFSWPEQGDDESQLRLPLTPPGAGVLTAVRLRFGPPAVRDVLALYLFTWAARAAAKEAVWWWPDEHLEICGLDDQTKPRRRLARLWARLGNARLRARYKHGRPLDGPVVSTIASDGGAFLLQFHPALYQGVTKTDGKPGDYFWPIPVGLLQLEADRSHGKVHVLAALLGAQWRRKWKADDPEGVVARVSAERLADSLALDGSRGHRSRAAETLLASLEAGKRCGLIERYEVERGKISDLSAMLQIFPAEPVGGRIERPKWIPATGDDLVRWMDTERLTASAVGELLGEKPATVRQWRSRYQGRPLPTRARRALRAALWGAFE